MKSVLNNESDDEYFDDPIKLFDSEQDRVHFGILPQGTATACNSYLSEGLINGNKEHLEKNDNSEDCEEFKCLPSYVKLVNCARFPWYFKRYTQQILEKTIIFDIASDSDTEYSVEPMADPKHDCFIEDEILTVHHKTNSEDIVPLLIENLRAEKRQAIKKRKEDVELEMALSRKNTRHIDFKRNIGLIGMTVTQKFVKDIGSEKGPIIRNKTKTSKVKDRPPKIVSKAVKSIKKDIKYIPEEHQTKHDANVLPEKVPVKFNLRTMPENLLQLIKTKKSDQYQEIKHIDNKLNTVPNEQTSSIFVAKVSLSPNKGQNSMCTATNLDTSYNYEKNRDTVPEPKRKEMTKHLNVELSPPKNINCISEPSSPILQCSLANKNKNIKQIVMVGENIFKGDEQNKQKEIKILNESGMLNAPNTAVIEHVISKEDKTKTSKEDTIKLLKNIKSSNLTSGKKVQKLSSIDKVTHQISNLAAQQETYAPYNNTYNFSITNNGSDYIHVHPMTQSKVYASHRDFIGPLSNTTAVDQHVVSTNSHLKYSSDGTGITNEPSMVESSQRINVITNINNNATLPCTTDTIQSKPTTVVSHPNINMPVKSQITCLPVQKITGDEVNNNNFNTLNDSAYGFCTSAVVLKPPQSNSFYSNARFNHPPLSINPLKTTKIPVQMQPQFYSNCYINNCYTLPHNGNQRFAPRFTNCSNNYYRFPTPQGNIRKPLLDTPPYSNITPNWRPRGDPNIPIFPSRLPISQTSSTKSGTLFEIKSHPSNILLTKINTQQQQNITINSVSTRKTKTLDPRVTKQTDKDIIVINATSEANSDLVMSKTTMLKLLDNTTNDFKRYINDSDDITLKNKNESFKKPKLTNEVTLNKTSCSDPQKGYSPPILPIPTYEKVLGQKNNKRKDASQGNIYSQININKGMIDTKDLNKKKVSGSKSQESVKKGFIKKSKDTKSKNDTNNRLGRNKIQEGSKKQNVKKISLEEYKKRTNSIEHVFGNTSRYNHKDNSEIFNKRAFVQSKPKSSVDRFSTESDLGYDSDSTVIL